MPPEPRFLDELLSMGLGRSGMADRRFTGHHYASISPRRNPGTVGQQGSTSSRRDGKVAVC
jgi:hypothetical protein